jgi:predicted ATPase
VVFNVKEMKDGIWIIEGDNGSGKSSILEAIGMKNWIGLEKYLFELND